MAQYSNLKAYIEEKIYENGTQAITGDILQDVLKVMTDDLGEFYQMGGVASPSTDPGTPDAKVIYFATEAGTYTNFGGITLEAGEVALLIFETSWTKETLNVLSSANGGVKTANLADGAVTTEKIAGGAVETAKIANNAVTSGKVADGAIGTAKIADGAIDADKIAANAVESAKIKNGAVTEGKINDGAVTADKVAANAVTADKIADDAVTTAKLNDGAVTEDKIATDAVTSGKVKDGAIGTAKIAAGAVTHAKIGAGAVEESNIKDGAVTSDKIANGAVGSDQLAEGAFSAQNLADGSVTTDKLADDAVTAEKIADGAVTADKFANGSVTTIKLGSGAVTTEKIGDGMVTRQKLADSSVGTSKIIDGAVTTDKVADGAITDAKLENPVSVSQNTITIGGEYAGEVSTTYDVTLHSGETFESLEDLLSDEDLATLIPANVRKGGMTIKFVQTIDNKYVQYFLTKNVWSASEADWEKMNLEKDLIKDFTNADNIYADKTYCLLNKESIQQNIDFKELPTYKKGAWMNSVGGEQVITENENHCILQFNPCGLRKFIATSQANLNLPSILIYNKQGTLIAWNPQPNMQAGVEYTWTLNPNIKIEDGCVGYINYFNYQQDTFVSSAVLEFDEPKKFADISNDIADISNDIADIINLTIPYQKFIDLYSANAGYIKPDGTAYNYDGNEYWKFSNFINCENRTIIDCNLRDGNNLVAVAFYTDKNEQSFLSSVNGNTGLPVQLNIPSCAKYVRFSSRTDYNSTSFVCRSDNSLETRVENLENTSSIIRTNKKWVAIGDSITWLDGNKQGVPQRPEHGYQHYLQQRIQFGSVVNNGRSGKTMFDYPFDEITTQGDIYSIALGINDWSDTKLTPVGTLADYKNYVTATGTGEYATVTNFAEALARLIIKIKRVSTNAFVILITPKRSNSYTSQTAHFPDTSIKANAGGIYLHQYADIIKEVAEYEGYPCVDLYHNGGFTDQNMSALCYDNLHPNDIGMMLIANDLYPAMEKICRTFIID